LTFEVLVVTMVEGEVAAGSGGGAMLNHRLMKYDPSRVENRRVVMG
jgi:hypothetical protein